MSSESYIKRVEQLNETQRKALRFVESCKLGCGINEIAANLGRTRSAANVAMRRLVEAGLVGTELRKKAKTQYLFYFISVQGTAIATKGELPNIAAREYRRLEDYKPAKWEPVRPGALDHEQIKSLGV
jgi:predicted transcriptional regulator